MCGPEEIKSIAKVGSKLLSGSSKFVDSLCRIRPGLAIASEARGIASANRVFLDALDETIARCRKAGFPESTTNGLCIKLTNEFSKTENLSGCLSFAQKVLGADYDASDIDHSWFIRWSDNAAEQTNDEMRIIWGELLAGELEQPGSYSKRAMSILADMGTDDARIFSDLCSTVVCKCYENHLLSSAPLIIMENDVSGNTFNNGRFDYSKISQLESLGLIDSSLRRLIKIQPNESQSFVVGNRSLTIRNDNDSEIEFSSSPVFTKFGTELSRLCNIGSCEDLAERFARAAINNNLTVYSSLSSLESDKG